MELETLPILVGMANQSEPDLIPALGGDAIEGCQNVFFALNAPIEMVDGLAKLVAEDQPESCCPVNKVLLELG